MSVRKKLLLPLCGLLLVGTILCCPAIRIYCLRVAGRFLVVQHSVSRADVIVVAVDAGSAGVLEASDLVHAGVSGRVAVFDEEFSAADREFVRRGLPYEHRTVILIRQFRSLGIDSVEQIPQPPTGSEQEGDILPGWCAAHGYHSIVVVTSSDHSRRLSRIFRRSAREHGLGIVVRSSPYSDFVPDEWWRNRTGVRTALFEFQKLLLDVARHPLA